MIFPSHCRLVGVVDKYARKDYRPEDAVYFSTQYLLIFDAPDRCEVYEVQGEGEDIMRRRGHARKISEADETLVFEQQVDITNRADLIKKAAKLCKNGINTVVFRGVDKHYNFVHKPDLSALTEVDVFDVAPPWPAWLAFNIKRQDEAGMYGDMMLDFKYHVVDLKDYEDPGRTTIFPCRASGLNGLFLDSLDLEPVGDIKLVGCNTSKLVFEARYPGKAYEHVNICPLSSPKPSRPFILRCCQSERLGLKNINGTKGVAVHWGANPREIFEAVKLLAAELKR
ncbi:hypothetical protein Mtc_1556 [Methanocella conradii HZ254]|uniref:Uncharacterized protein n=1 Tax=Methanocella conradii (strain DSM 24694 / JCM 17849 / CGMCC 1.5162 / HZ254) TaxID=1041930 RepID=H8I757_METCZ|nr:hypothetical protein [Methanocella conradii]AFD00308.1 hypothetical protein Mtc_1556 [Methanocella conradii HZ254]